MATKKTNPNRSKFGVSSRRWRNMMNVSQQNIHVLCEAAGIDIYNSQISQLEQGVLVPDVEKFFLELKKLNMIIASGKYPKTVSKTGKFTREVKEKFKDAEPYLDAENNPVLMAKDFVGIFIGECEINPKYLMEGVKITESTCENISNYGRTVFTGFATDEMMTKKEAWESFLPYIEKTVKKQQQRRIQSVFAGQSDYTLEEVKSMTDNGRNNSCVINDALTDWTGQQMPDVVDVWTKGSKMKWPSLAA